jgi:hypothetical protein
VFKDITRESRILSILSETVGDDGAYTASIRVISQPKWDKMIVSILKAAHESEDFGSIIRKEFYLNDEGVPSYIWSLLLWGDLDVALKTLSPILEKKGAPPAPPPSISTSVPITKPSLNMYKRKDGSEEVVVPLPHRRGSRAVDTSEVVKVGGGSKKKRVRAFVSNIGE